MFGLGTGELLVILVIALVMFGGSRLPEIGRGLGEGMRGFRDALKGEPERKDTPVARPPDNPSPRA
jgi:sec-independent protein translocase protein TatA